MSAGQHVKDAEHDALSDMFEDVFARQAALAAFYARVRPGGFYAARPLDRCATWTRAIVHECCELDNEFNWKPWKNATPLDATREARLAEMADILHFFAQLALDQGFSARDIHAAYVRKNGENQQRQADDSRYRPSRDAAASAPDDSRNDV